MSRPFQLRSQRRVTVDLTVEDDVDRAVLVAVRLMPVENVDDRQPSNRQGDALILEDTRLVGSAVCDRERHLLEQSLATGYRPGDAGDATHRRNLIHGRPSR